MGKCVIFFFFCLLFTMSHSFLLDESLDDVWVSPELPFEEWAVSVDEDTSDISLPEFYELKDSPITMHQLHYISNKKNTLLKQKVLDRNVVQDLPPSQEKEEEPDLMSFQDWLCFDQEVV